MRRTKVPRCVGCRARSFHCPSCGINKACGKSCMKSPDGTYTCFTCRKKQIKKALDLLTE